MDKITRLLLMYTRFITGERVNKFNFCMETEISFRTFDRDIEDIRLYLSEFFCVEELKYDRKLNEYYIEGFQRSSLEHMEMLFLKRILLDTGALRKDEMEGLLLHLVENSEDRKNAEYKVEQEISKYNEPSHKKAIMKMHGDLSIIIEQNKIIEILYLKANGQQVKRDIIPCEVKYDLGYLYLIGYPCEEQKTYPAYYRLDRIHSFKSIRKQKQMEKDLIKNYLKQYSMGITQMYGGRFVKVILECKKEFYQYIYDKFRISEIIDEQEDKMHVKINVFEDGFLKWLLSQPIEFVSVIKPESVRKRVLEETEKIIKKYKGE